MSERAATAEQDDRSGPKARGPRRVLAFLASLLRKVQQQRWSSPFRAFLWKEWRQQFWVFASLAVLGPLGLWVGVDWSAFAALLISGGLVVGACPVVLAAYVFAGERDDHTCAFSERLPYSPRKMFGVKLLVAVTAALVAFSLWLTTVMLANLDVYGYTPYEVAQARGMWLELLGGGITATVLFCLVTIGVASLDGSAMVTVLASCGVGSLLVRWVHGNVVLLRALHIGDWLIAVDVGVAAGGALLVALVLSVGHPAGTWDRVARAALGLAFFVVLVAVPPGVAYLHELFVLSPSDYLAGDLGPTRHANGAISAHEEAPYVAVECNQPWKMYWQNSRVVLLNTATGEWKWFDRFRVNALPMQQPWSPDGTRCVLQRHTRAVWPLNVLNPAAPFNFRRPHADPTTMWLFDARTGQSRPLPESSPALGSSGWGGWADTDTLWQLVGEHASWFHGIAFFDVATGASRICAAVRRTDVGMGPGVFFPPQPGADSVPRHNSKAIPGHGLFRYWLATQLDADSNLAMRVYQFRPELDVARRTRLSHPWRRPAPVAVSPDGLRLLVRDVHPTESQACRYFVCLLSSGEVAEIAAPEGPEYPQNLRDIRGRPVFLPDSRRAAFRSGRGLLLFDVVSKEWRQISVGDDRKPTHTWGSGTFASPDGRYAVLSRFVSLVVHSWVVDLETTESWHLWKNANSAPAISWCDNDTLLVRTQSGLWLVNRDGTGRQKLLPRE